VRSRARAGAADELGSRLGAAPAPRRRPVAVLRPVRGREDRRARSARSVHGVGGGGEVGESVGNSVGCGAAAARFGRPSRDLIGVLPISLPTLSDIPALCATWDFLSASVSAYPLEPWHTSASHLRTKLWRPMSARSSQLRPMGRTDPQLAVCAAALAAVIRLKHKPTALKRKHGP
jgi:hypothetical protein